MENYKKIMDAGVGAVLLLTVGPHKGEKAIVYEIYELVKGKPGASVLTETLSDQGGYSADELEKFTQYIGKVELRYEYKNQIGLYQAIQNNVFKETIERIKSM